MTQLFETQATPITGYAQVALEQGIDANPDGLTYAIPESLIGLRVGDRVIVPLGKRDKAVYGYAIAVSNSDPKQPGQTTLVSAGPGCFDRARIKPILRRDPAGVSLTADLVALAKWIAGYYCTPLGMVFATMLPAAVKHGIGRVTRTMVSLSPQAHHDAQPTKCTKLQKAVLDAAIRLTNDDHPWVEIKDLAQRAGARTVTPVKQLIDKGMLTTQQQTAVGPRSADPSPRADQRSPDVRLTDDQKRAIDQLVTHIHNGFSVHLLHGVTGSGKTLVYVQVIERVLSHFKPSTGQTPGAIVLVPEIALTTQTIARFADQFEGVAALHSGLTAAQRHEQWRRIRSGTAHIVIGARSAIFAPLPNLGVIIVDEEHDPSYKQDQLPRYHGRDVAIKRAQILKIPVVLGSATPSLETYFNTIPAPTSPGGPTSPTGKRPYHLLRLPTRVAGLRLPHVQIVDMKQERRTGGMHLLSGRLEQALRNTLAQRSQAILLLNRRGYANYIACPDHRCGWLMCCEDCDATMVYHKAQNLPTGGVLRCHHCRAQQILPSTCPMCGKKVTVFGMGTQRVEEEITRKFPKARLLRMDSDAMGSGRDYQRGLDAFGRGELDVVVGTQMIAKGLDFPNVRLVGVISADTSLHIPDFRAAERTFQLIAQVAGRAGRGDPKQGSTVIVQSFNPEDPAIVLASRHDYEGFAQREIELRHQVGLPPWSRMARVVVRDQDHKACEDRAKRLAQQLESFSANLELFRAVQIRGPMPCPIARIATFHRQQIELVASEPAGAASLQKLLTALRNARLLRSDARTAVDVDPVALL